jgi:hypothetical protein
MAGSARLECVDMCFNDQHFLRELRHIGQSRDWIKQMVEHAQEQNDVEHSNSVGTKIGDVDVQRLDIEAESGESQIKALASKKNRMCPSEVISGENSRCSAAFGLETISAIPSADVDYRPAVRLDRIKESRVFGTMNVK